MEAYVNTSFAHPLFGSFMSIFLKPQSPLMLRTFGWGELLHSKLAASVASSSVWDSFDLASVAEEQDPKLLQLYGTLLNTIPEECPMFRAIRTHPKFSKQ
eukprot:TRINITY_DN8778_c0_g1_i1.p1 TRINITY_DN8778_c0_g1~~TRINITY_DN8778_c0_g1_i1.p1  ORF type:complete len:100 (+),score=20.79 TRINITY_DN8778_c0_g1_i1:795-1094(+)